MDYFFFFFVFFSLLCCFLCEFFFFVPKGRILMIGAEQEILLRQKHSLSLENLTNKCQKKKMGFTFDGRTKGYKNKKDPILPKVGN